jgi:phosphotransferase system IIB component
LNTLLEEKDTEIQNLKKKLKMPHDAHVQTAELKTILQEKQILENELQNTKAVVGTIKDKKEMLENQVKLLKDKVDQLSLSNPNFPLVTNIGELSIKDLEFKKVQEELEKVNRMSWIRISCC